MFFTQEALGSTLVPAEGAPSQENHLVSSLRKKVVWDVVSVTVMLYKGHKPVSAFAT